MILPSAFIPNTYYFSLIAQGKSMEIGVGERYIKQSYRNRTDLLTSNGRIAFTVPVSKIGYPSPYISEVLISEHGQWRDKLWQLLTSAYHSAPYWEHYAYQIERCIFNPQPRLVDYNLAWVQMICDLIKLPCPTLVAEGPEVRGEVIDPQYLRSLPSPKRYWQVFETKFGFQPFLSTLDMLLNLGPESRLILCEASHTAWRD